MSQRGFDVRLISSSEELKKSFLRYNMKGKQNRSNKLTLSFIENPIINYSFHFISERQDRQWFQPNPSPKFVILLLKAYEEISLDMITQINKQMVNALYFMIVIDTIDKCDGKMRRYMEQVVGLMQLKTIARCSKLDASCSNLSGQFCNSDQFLKNLLFAAGAYERKCIEYTVTPNKEGEDKQQLKLLLQDMLDRNQIGNKQIIIQFLLEFDVNTALIFVPAGKRVPLFNFITNCQKYQIYLKIGKLEIKNEKLSFSIRSKAQQQTHNLLCHLNIKQMEKNTQAILSNKISLIVLQEEQKQRFQIQYKKCKIIQVYQQLLKYEEQLQFCYTNNLDSVYKQEAQQFFQCIFKQSRQSIQKLKKQCIYDSADQFKYKNPRQKVQYDIQNEFLSSNQKQNHLKYVKDPAHYIAEKYSSLTQISLGELKQRILSSIKGKIYQFQQQKYIFQGLLTKLKSQQFQSANHNQLFLITRLNLQDMTSSKLNEEISHLVYILFVDLLQSKPKLVYKGTNIQLKVKNLNSFNSIGKVFRKISTDKYKYSNNRISNLFEFVKNVLNQFDSSSVRNFMNQMTSLTNNDINLYRKQSAVYICKQRCPGCGKLCSLDTPHQKHEIRFGHQIRALGGVKMNNGVGSAVTCENVEENSLIQFNGQKITWKQFKNIFETKKENSWSFKDFKQKNKYAQAAKKSWAIIGQSICQNYGFKYEKENEKANYSKVESIHYIFALDDSGSMHGQRWQNLMNSFRITIQQIQSLPEAHKYIKVSVLIQGSTCLIYQQNSLVNMVNTGIPFRSGGNNFSETFEKAYQIMCKYIGTEKIKFIFMTDGGCSYPEAQIQKIKQLKLSYPKKIEYYGIQFQCSGDVMKKISQQLDGKNTVSHTADNLTNNYLESAMQMEIINLM